MIDYRKITNSYSYRKTNLADVEPEEDGDQVLLTMIAGDNGTVEPTTDDYDKYEVVPINAVPNDGFKFFRWLIGGVEDLKSLTKTTMDKSKSAIAEFIAQWTLTTSVVGNGTIEPLGDNIYDDGTVVDLTVTPDVGSQIDRVEEDGSPIIAPYQSTMDADKGVIAYFDLLYSVPFGADAIEIWTGEILNDGGTYYFVGKKGVGNLLITDYDFDVSEGFPLKSIATVSAPIGNTTLINGDVNNFFYTAGTPNEIPVVSFFQDIDYENTLFNRHEAQILSATGAEIYEARIKDIVLYNTVKTGADLVTCQSYYEVPVEDISAKWVTPLGNDTTGDGSKGNPYLTIIKAVTVFQAGQLIYVTTGIVEPDFYDRYDNIIQSIGRVIVQPDGTYIRFDQTSQEINGMFVQPLNQATSLIFGFFNPILRILNNHFESTQHIINTSFSEFSNNVVKGTYSTDVVDLVSNVTTNAIVKNNYFDVAIGAKYIFRHSCNCDILFKNNKSKNDETRGVILDKIATLAQYIGNEIKGKNTFGNGYGLLIQGNQFTDNTIINYRNDTKDVDYNNNHHFNTFTNINSRAVIDSNVFDCLVNPTSDLIIGILKGNTNVITEYELKNNVLLLDRDGNFAMLVGADSSSVGDNTISNIILENNRVENIATTGSIHGIMVGYQDNPEVRYNYIKGGIYGFIFEGNATAWTSGGCYYNLIQNTNRGIVQAGIDDAVFANNTIHTTKTMVQGVSLETTSDNCIVKNNIIVALGTGNNLMITIEAATTHQIDYNIYYSPNGTMQFNAGSGIIDFATWQGLGHDANSIILTYTQYNNLFTDVGNDDFSIKTGAIALLNGVTITGYGNGLDASTDFGTDETIPVVVNETQPTQWTIGAYIN